MPRKPKRSTWGCVEQARPGVWRIRYQADTGDGRGYTRRSETVHGTRREAHARLAELRERYEVAPGEPVRRPSPLTVGEAWERWVVPEMERSVESGKTAGSTWNAVLSQWRRHAAPRWSSTPCRDVRPLDMQEWLLGLKKNAAVRSVANLNRVFAKAVLYGVVDSNPMSVTYEMPGEEAHGDAGIYTLDELMDVCRAVHGSLIEPAVLLMAFGSCRVGESLGVMCSEVALSESCGVTVATVPIVRQMKERGGMSDRLKTKQSARTVVLPGPMGKRLVEIADERAGDGDLWLVDNGFGSPIAQQTAAKLWGRLLKAAGIEHHPMKNLRASWQTNARWVLGIAPDAIETLMGHRIPTVTGMHYDRPTDEMLVEAVAGAYARHPFADSWGMI